MAKRFIQYFEDSFKENWDLPAMTNYETKQTFKYSDVAREIAKLHLLFRELNIQQDDKIALVGNNSPEWAITFLATITYGAVIVPIMQNFTPSDQVNAINHSDSIFLFADDECIDRLEMNDMPKLRAVFSLSDYRCVYQQQGESIHLIMKDLYQFFLSKYSSGFTINDVVYTDKSDDSLMVLNYTSGTTGYGKAVMLSGRNFIPQVRFADDNHIGEKNATYLLYIPLAHAGGYTVFLSLIRGTQILILNHFPSPKELIEITQKEKPNYFVMVPMVLEMIFKDHIQSFSDNAVLSDSDKQSLYRKCVDLFGGNVHRMFIGGASLDKNIETFLSTIKFPYVIGYGMTETASAICTNIGLTLQSVGKPLEGVDVCIDSDDSLNIPGEILVRGMNVMKGYYKSESETKNVFTEDGWLKTGDLGIWDRDGILYLKGRCKSMILTSSGQNVYPESIEKVINNSAFVIESVVVQDGNRIIALVYPNYENLRKKGGNDSAESLLDEVRKEVNKQLTSYENISEFIIHDTPFVKTAKKSIKRYLYEIKK